MENTPLERLDTVNAYIVCSEVFDVHYQLDLGDSHVVDSHILSSEEKRCSRDAVRNSLHHVFGPAVKPHPRDVQRVSQEGKHSNVDNVNRTTDFPMKSFLDPLDFEGFAHTHSIRIRLMTKNVSHWVKGEQYGTNEWIEHF